MKTMKRNGLVKINGMPKDHINEYARIDEVDNKSGIVYVSNMNMPFQGTFGRKSFKFNEVQLVKYIE